MKFLLTATLLLTSSLTALAADPACGGTEIVTNCSSGRACTEAIYTSIRRGKNTYRGDGAGADSIYANPCNRDYGGLRLVCDRDYNSTPAGEAFGRYGSLTCRKRKNGDPNLCYNGTNGWLSYTHGRNFYCS